MSLHTIPVCSVWPHRNSSPSWHYLFVPNTYPPHTYADTVCTRRRSRITGRNRQAPLLGLPTQVFRYGTCIHASMGHDNYRTLIWSRRNFGRKRRRRLPSSSGLLLLRSRLSNQQGDLIAMAVAQMSDGPSTYDTYSMYMYRICLHRGTHHHQHHHQHHPTNTTTTTIHHQHPPTRTNDA